MNWYVGVLKNYAGFSGRARRTEYWMFYLFNMITTIVAVIIDQVIGYPVLTVLYSLGIVIPSLAVTVRRLHDTNRSGGWFFVGFIPFVGWIFLLVFLVSAGTPGPNQFGQDPKQQAPVGY